MVMLPHTPLSFPGIPLRPTSHSASSTVAGVHAVTDHVESRGTVTETALKDVTEKQETRTSARPQGVGNRLVRVYLVDDHQMILDCLSAYLTADSQFEVVGKATNTEQAIIEIAQIQPDVVVMDVELPGRSVFDVAETLRTKAHGVRVIYLSGYASDVLLSRALKPGCYGYLLKGEPVSAIRQAILRAIDGEMSFSPEIRQRLAQDPVSRRFSLPADTPLTGLTGRQLEVLRHLANGASVKEIARLMHLSQKSVDSHKYRIMHKLGIHDRVELARFAIREGLTKP